MGQAIEGGERLFSRVSRKRWERLRERDQETLRAEAACAAARRRAASATMARPASSMHHVDGSGTGGIAPLPGTGPAIGGTDPIGDVVPTGDTLKTGGNPFSVGIDGA